jgi:hypothetical protein
VKIDLLPRNISRLMARHGLRARPELLGLGGAEDDAQSADFDAMRVILLTTKGITGERRKALTRWAREAATPSDAVAALQIATKTAAEQILLPNLNDACLPEVLMGPIALDWYGQSLGALRSNPAATLERLREATAQAGNLVCAPRPGQNTPPQVILARLAHLHERDPEVVTPQTYERIAELALDPTGAPESFVQDRAAILVTLLCSFTNFVPALSRPLYEIWVEQYPEHGTDRVAHALANDSRNAANPTPIEILRDLARRPLLPRPDRALAQCERAVLDHEIRGEIIRMGDLKSLEAIRPYLADGAEYRQAFLRLASFAPASALGWWDQLPPPESFREEEVAALLSSPHAELRLRALVWWGARSAPAEMPRATSKPAAPRAEDAGAAPKR